MAEVLAGKYRLDRLLGKGGMGEVFDAEQLATGRRVALKRMLQQEAHGGHLLREARAIGAVRSPYIVDVLDAGTDEATGQPFLVMEFLTGSDLSTLLSQGRKLPVEAALRIAIHVCRGLEKAHAVGLVHRDIKPANLFLVAHDDESYRVKIVDFGLARAIVHENGELGEDDLTQLSRTNSIVGSPAYMAPEQIRGLKSLNHRSDIWSLGVVLYRMLTGRPPHTRGDAGVGDLLMAICCSPAPPVQQLAPWVPDELAQIVHTALSLEPEDRFQSIREMSEALERLAPDARLQREMLGQLPSGAFSSTPAARGELEATSERSTLALDRGPSTPRTFALPPASVAPPVDVPPPTLVLTHLEGPAPPRASRARVVAVAAAGVVLGALVVVLSAAQQRLPIVAPAAAPLPAPVHSEPPTMASAERDAEMPPRPEPSALDIPVVTAVGSDKPAHKQSAPSRRPDAKRGHKQTDPFVRTFK